MPDSVPAPLVQPHPVQAWLIGKARRHRTPIAIGVAVTLAAVALVALLRLTHDVRLVDVRRAFNAIDTARVGIALALTAASYLALTFYDVLALRIIGRPLPWRTAALASVTSYTLSHNLGLALLTGGSARYRVYTAAGLDGPDVARVVAIAGATFWMGVLAVAGVALSARAEPLSLEAITLSPGVARLVGGAVVALCAGAVLLCAGPRRRIGAFGWTIPLPRPAQALAQIGIATIDIAAAAAALYMLIPGADPALLPTFVLAYALAIIATVVTHVPGGVGVFEAVVIAVVPGDKAALFAALIAYRVIYYLLPLAVGIVLLTWAEGRRGLAQRTLSGARSVATGMAPLLMSVASFLGGAMLLMSGSLPGVPDRLHALRDVVPLPFIEASHLASSLVGTGLLLLAPALYRRLDGAFAAIRALLLAGAAFSIFKGVDYEEAAVCIVIAMLLQWTRHAFYRRTELIARPLSTPWLACVVAMVGLSIWVGFFSYKHVDYQNDLWWQFALRDDASRFLRASLGVGVVLGGAALWRLFAAAPPPPTGTADPGEIARLLATAERTEATLALTGDKRFLLSPQRDAFLMYQVRGTSWIVMGDPVGAREAWPDLLWSIRDLADAAQGRLLLYQITPAALELAIEMGLGVIKYGEEGLVDLAGFALDGTRPRSLRQAYRRAEREGASFAVVPRADVPALLPELARVSREWLAAKGQREKAFSLGRFDPAYVVQFDCAVVRHEGRVIAFANLWTTANKAEVSVDLMRHADAGPQGVMDYLFVSLMLWGKAQGYARFSLGLAPLSGIEGRRLAPVWAKAASILFNHGERLYGFKGLRSYKQKFAPVWEARFIAGPNGLALLQALRDLSALVSRPRPPAHSTKAVRRAKTVPAKPGIRVDPRPFAL